VNIGIPGVFGVAEDRISVCLQLEIASGAFMGTPFDRLTAAVAIKTAVRHQDVAVGIESEKIAEGLDSDDGAGDGIVFGNRILEKDLQGFPVLAAEIGKKLPIFMCQLLLA